MGAHVTQGDLEILIRPTPDNAQQLLGVLTQFGFAQSGFKEADFVEPDQMIQLGQVPSRIALLTSISGVSTNEAFASKISAMLDGIPVFILGKDALIPKQATGRPATGSRGPCSTRGLIFRRLIASRRVG